MELYGITKCITYHELVGKIISKSNYKKHVRKKKIKVLTRGGNGRKVLVDYESLPPDLREKYDALFPDADNDLTEQLASDMIKRDSKAVEFFRHYTLSDGSGLTDIKQAEYVLNAEVFNEMRRVESETKSLHSKSGHTRSSLVKDIVLATCEKLREQYKHTLPGSSARMWEKFKAYKKEGYSALISRKCGNQNTRKIGSKEARLLLKLRRSKFPIYTEQQIFEEYNRQAVERGLNIIKSPTSVRNFLFEPSVMPLWYSTVYGELEFKKKYSAQFDTEMPCFRDSLWYADGTKLNLYYRDENGKMCTTSVYEVMDAYSEVLLGYDIAPNERFDNQYRAFRMAVETAKVKPYEIVVDNQGGHKKLVAQGFFKRICHVFKHTMPYNGQSKTIESAFGRFQQQILHKVWHFTGQNITAKKIGSRPNLEFIMANAHALPTLDEVKELYAQLRQEWNNAVHHATGMARIDMYNESSNPRTVPVTHLDMVQMFWLKHSEPITYTNRGIRFTLNGQTYKYEVYDENYLRDERFAMKNTGRKFHIMYDPQDMTLIELWKEKAKGLVFETQATPRLNIHRATQDTSRDEILRRYNQIENSKAVRAAMEIMLEDFDLSEEIAAEYYGLVTPKPKGISQKKMDEYRKDYKHGKLSAPIEVPEAMEEPETIGEWEKATSNATFDEDFWDRY